MTSFLSVAILSLFTPLPQAQDAAPGQLTSVSKDKSPGLMCPLEGTRVRGFVAGLGARVTLVQTFKNPSSSAIEAVYTFPLPENAAVDRMRFKIGDRIIEGMIKKKAEAKQIYNQAKEQGRAAALLDQERPNLFVQSVANIAPSAKVEVEISYVQTMRYEDGEFTLNFPMVVAPRFSRTEGANAPLNPVYSPTRTGSNIDLQFEISAGSPILNYESVLHKVVVTKDNTLMRVKLANANEIPNKDFIFKYQVATDSVQPAMVDHWDSKLGGHFCFMMYPPKAPTAQLIAPREMLFVMDQSGSQGGFPIEKSREVTLKMLDRLRPEDTFNIFGFNTVVKNLFPTPRLASSQNLSEARAFVNGMEANGGTFVQEGVVASLGAPADPTRLRMVVFNTDGLVDSEREVLAAIQQHRGSAHMFTFGIGNNVNRYLLDAMSVEGRGDVEYVTQASEADKAVARFAKRTETPTLIDVTAKFDGGVLDTSPNHLPDLFGGRPIIIYGRYAKPGPISVKVQGTLGGKLWEKTLKFALGNAGKESAVPTLWARSKVDDLSRQNYVAQFDGKPSASPEAAITDLGLRYGIMTNYTSFVAVDSQIINRNGKQVRVEVPVDVPDGMDKLADSSSGFRGQMGGGGSGGFGGRPAGSPVTVSAPLQRTELSKVAYDPTDNSLVIAGKQEKTFTKIDPTLQKATGTVKYKLTAKAVDKTLLENLKKLKVKVLKVDKRNNQITCQSDAKGLESVAKLEAVQKLAAIPSKK